MSYWRFMRNHANQKRRDARHFEPLEDTRGLGFITGWAVIENATPQMIQVLDGETVLGETAQFLPRPDVRDGLPRGGAGVASALLGFAVRLRQPFNRDGIVLRIKATSGQSQDVPLSRVSLGASIAVGSGCFVGIDSERQPTAV